MPQRKSQRVKEWFLKNRRALPWRENPTPYRVLVSEIMLQQTQASVVIPYFQRWMELFPTIEALATAPEERVIKAWEGLGYYSRARNLHAAAKAVMERHGGVLPDNAEELGKIKGLGPYTTGAVLSFAFKQKAAAIDGNVQRVVSRLSHITEDVTRKEGKAALEKALLELIDDEEPWILSEALIELGAMICKKKTVLRPLPGSRAVRRLRVRRGRRASDQAEAAKVHPPLPRPADS